MSTETKKGRPTKFESALSHDCKVRVDNETYSELLRLSATKQVTIAEIIREAILSYIKK